MKSQAPSVSFLPKVEGPQGKYIRRRFLCQSGKLSLHPPAEPETIAAAANCVCIRLLPWQTEFASGCCRAKSDGFCAGRRLESFVPVLLRRFVFLTNPSRGGRARILRKLCLHSSIQTPGERKGWFRYSQNPSPSFAAALAGTTSSETHRRIQGAFRRRIRHSAHLVSVTGARRLSPPRRCDQARQQLAVGTADRMQTQFAFDLYFSFLRAKISPNEPFRR